jgi:serine/threonine protein phosphatase 1
MNTTRTIAFGDIHGCAKSLLALLEKLNVSTEDTLIFLGDYIDRGPNSKGVVICIMALIENGFNVITLRGNHEQMFMDSEYGFLAFNNFIQNGGDKTLENLGQDFFHELPQHFQEFFTNTKHFYETGTHIFVHAGLNFDNEDIFADEEAMLWTRGFSNQQEKLGSRKLVHGHTPIPLKDLLNQKGNCINIDNGCVYKGKAEGFGNLVAYICETGEYVYVEYCEYDDVVEEK